MDKFIRDAEGNYSLNGYYIGTSIEDGESFYQHLYDDGDMTLIDVIDDIAEYGFQDFKNCEAAGYLT